ncbi:AbrB/MazE/SpoVT family DNA-binding domain-containing protein [Deinococcus sp. RL]|uniref:AbrB/MazE/SpoVT family DNA-binding domain-containing protein n=1 Tax=Deinococcus sp. RL TaxID=1489678 RepID=UPI00055222A0|nr:AbrB/MazE/SpoVT family DNA-binding domain-containing protein [Deinococcus sp. RL]
MRTKTVTVSSKGQVVLPREVRERLGVGQGDRIEFVMDEQGIHVRPSRGEGNPFLAWVGAAPLPEGYTTDDFIRETRHEGLSDEELRLLRSGPGARVTRMDEVLKDTGSRDDRP